MWTAMYVSDYVDPGHWASFQYKLRHPQGGPDSLAPGIRNAALHALGDLLINDAPLSPVAAMCVQAQHREWLTRDPSFRAPPPSSPDPASPPGAPGSLGRCPLRWFGGPPPPWQQPPESHSPTIPMRPSPRPVAGGKRIKPTTVIGCSFRRSRTCGSPSRRVPNSRGAASDRAPSRCFSSSHLARATPAASEPQGGSVRNQRASSRPMPCGFSSCT